MCTANHVVNTLKLVCAQVRHRAKTDQTSSKCLVEAKRNSRPHISFRHDQSPRIPFRMRQKGTVVESVHTSNSRNLSDVSMLTQDQGQSSQQGQDSFRQHCRFVISCCPASVVRLIIQNALVRWANLRKKAVAEDM